MAFFKLNKNKTASAAPSPAQTPRSSMQASRPSGQNKMTVEQAMEEMNKNVPASGPAFSINLVLHDNGRKWSSHYLLSGIHDRQPSNNGSFEALTRVTFPTR
ncbi:hypothetical protein BGW42_005172 [Actinomortierella wolfii]|nr:hypothetical protein BGW42_005172 [Actinomortierella wolfii]